jgi:hypothetical protein
MGSENASKPKLVKLLIESGSEITGGVAGTAIGLLAAGPAGAITGAAVGPLITKALHEVGAELATRIMGPRGRMRVGATLGYAIVAVDRRLKAGDQLRGDGFFERSDAGRASAEEVAEGVLRAANEEHQEAKLEYYGNLLANIAFDSSVSVESAAYLVKCSRDLSYRQLGLLALVGRIGEVTQPISVPYLADQMTLAEFDAVIAGIRAGTVSSDEVVRAMRTRVPGPTAVTLLEEVRSSHLDAVTQGLDTLRNGLAGDLPIDIHTKVSVNNPEKPGYTSAIHLPLSYRLEPILLAEIQELSALRLIGSTHEGTFGSLPELTTVGRLLFRLMALETFSLEYLQALGATLQQFGEGPLQPARDRE